jgi:hypothetical protein
MLTPSPLSLFTGGCAQSLKLNWRSLFNKVSQLDLFERLGNLAPSMKIGFTLTNANPGGTELLDRIQMVTRETLSIAKQRGYEMCHVGDDPVRFGLSSTQFLSRKHDGTSTSWLALTKQFGL